MSRSRSFKKLSGREGQFRQLFVSALTKPAERFSERNPDTMTPEEHDRWFCSPYISSISFQINRFCRARTSARFAASPTPKAAFSLASARCCGSSLIAALIAAALAVAATSATTVLERRGEIGILKAIGATNAIVAGMFLTEQLLLAIAGGLFGFVIGLALAWVLGASIFGSPASPQWVLLPVILGIASIVAVLGSLIPLRQAARFDPAPILRGE